MTGTFSINHKPTVILFDSGATHSFISDKCGARVGLESSQATAQYMITTPGGKIVSNQILRHVPIQLGSKLIKNQLDFSKSRRYGCYSGYGLDDPK